MNPKTRELSNEVMEMYDYYDYQLDAENNEYYDEYRVSGHTRNIVQDILFYADAIHMWADDVYNKYCYVVVCWVYGDHKVEVTVEDDSIILNVYNMFKKEQRQKEYSYGLDGLARVLLTARDYLYEGRTW